MVDCLESTFGTLTTTAKMDGVAIHNALRNFFAGEGLNYHGGQALSTKFVLGLALAPPVLSAPCPVSRVAERGDWFKVKCCWWKWRLAALVPKHGLPICDGEGGWDGFASLLYCELVLGTVGSKYDPFFSS